MRGSYILTHGLLLTVLLLCSACGSAAGKHHPVSGKVLFQGKPAEGARVVFVPVNNSDPSAARPTGTVGADGSFTLTTPGAGTGAPAGEYHVAIAWTDTKPRSGDESGDIVNKLPPRYADPKTSKLTALVQEGPTELPPFQLLK